MIDASIPLQVQAPRIEDQGNALMRVLQMRNLQQEGEMNTMRAEAARREFDRTNKLYDLLQSSPDAATLRRSGYLKEANDMEKNAAEVAEKTSTTTKNRVEAATKKIGAARDMMFNVGDPQTAAQLISTMHADPDLKDTIGAVPLPQLLAQIPQDPAQFGEFKNKFSMGAEKFMADLRQRQQLQETNRHNTTVEGETGRHNVASETNAAGQLAVSQGQLKETRRHNTTTEEQNGIEYKQDANGQWVALPKKIGAGPIQARTVEGVPGKQVAAATKVLPILDNAEQLIDQATGSYLGAAYDQAGRVIGQSPAGADAIAKLKVLEGQIMMAQPRMEGPQSDKDTMLYRQMAGQIGDATVPRDQKKAALNTIREIQTRYAGGAQTPATSAPATPSSPRVPRIKGDAEYNALPSGATFIGPDGKQRRKP